MPPLNTEKIKQNSHCEGNFPGAKDSMKRIRTTKGQTLKNTEGIPFKLVFSLESSKLICSKISSTSVQSRVISMIFVKLKEGEKSEEYMEKFANVSAMAWSMHVRRSLTLSVLATTVVGIHAKIRGS